jgi:hypothetical protein
MKTNRLFGMTTLIMGVMLILSFAACDDGNGGGGNQDVMGAKLRLYDKPVTKDASATDCTATDFGYTVTSWDPRETEPLSNMISGTPKVTISNDKLTIELDALKNTALVPLALLSESYPGTTLTPADAKYYGLVDFYESTGIYSLRCLNLSASNFAYFFYVDKNATLNGTINGDGINYVFDVTLQAGWNYYFMTYDSNTNTVTVTATRTLPDGYNWMMSGYQ